MMGEYLKEKDNRSSMFTNLQTQNFHPPPSAAAAPTANLLQHHSLHNAFHVTTNQRECQTSDEVDSQRSPASANRELSIQPMHLQAVGSSGNDGASIEVVRRPRGRPPGSKNKPKPPVVVTRDGEPSMSPYVLEISAGTDIVESVRSFCRSRNICLSVLSGSGTVADVTIRQSHSNPPTNHTFPGVFELVSLTATIFPPNANILNSAANEFIISIASPGYQIFGGTVIGSLVAAGTVYLIAAALINPLYSRLPLEDDQRNSGSAGGCAPERGHRPSPSAISGGGDDGRSPAPTSTGMESCGLPMYGHQLQSDGMWSSTPRQPPQQQHPPHY